MLISVKSDDEKWLQPSTRPKVLKQFLDALFAPKPNQKHFC